MVWGKNQTIKYPFSKVISQHILIVPLGGLQEGLLSQGEVVTGRQHYPPVSQLGIWKVMSDISQPSSLYPFHGDSMMNKNIKSQF